MQIYTMTITSNKLLWSITAQNRQGSPGEFSAVRPLAPGEHKTTPCSLLSPSVKFKNTHIYRTSPIIMQTFGIPCPFVCFMSEMDVRRHGRRQHLPRDGISSTVPHRQWLSSSAGNPKLMGMAHHGSRFSNVQRANSCGSHGMRCSELEHFRSHEEQHLIGEESIADLSQVQAGFGS